MVGGERGFLAVMQALAAMAYQALVLNEGGGPDPYSGTTILIVVCGKEERWADRRGESDLPTALTLTLTLNPTDAEHVTPGGIVPTSCHSAKPPPASASCLPDTTLFCTQVLVPYVPAGGAKANAER